MVCADTGTPVSEAAKAMTLNRAFILREAKLQGDPFTLCNSCPAEETEIDSF
jgi:hypothetical protein